MEENLAKKIEQITIPFAIYFSRKWSPFSYNIPQIVSVFIVCFGYIPFAMRTSVSYDTTFATPPGLVAVASKHETNIKKSDFVAQGNSGKVHKFTRWASCLSNRLFHLTQYQSRSHGPAREEDHSEGGFTYGFL